VVTALRALAARTHKEEARLSSTGVTLLRWPDEEPRRAALAAVGAPRLLVLDEHSPPPICFDELEDWVRVPLDDDEVETRTAVLSKRAEPRPVETTLDEDDRILWRGAQWVQLSEAQLPVVRLLLARRGQVVSRDEIAAVARESNGSADPRAIKSLMGRIDKRTRPIGVEVHSVRGRGWMLAEATASTPCPPNEDAFAISSFVSNKSETRAEATSTTRILVSTHGPSRTDR
jgi:DNA-binding winged helix-turn-helix (wHTH) protein